MSKPKLGALFAGYGGLDLAVEAVFDATTAWVSEVDAAPSRILAQRFPDAPNHGDVTKIDWSAVEPVDIITGGSPCQDLSHAGKRAGMKAGTRSGLWASMCDAIETIRPRFVVWENVRGALSAEADSAVEPCPICMGDGRGVTLRALGRVLGDLAELGYDAAWVGLRAADVGAPHGRYRVFVLAWDASRPAGLGGDASAAVPADLGYERSGAARDGRPGSADGRRGDDLTLLPTPAVNDMGAGKTVDAWDAWTDRMKSAHGNGNGHGNSLHIEALRMLPTPTRRDHKGANQRGDDTCLTGALLPTPRATDGTKGGPNQRGSSGDLMLPSAVQLLPTPRATRGGSGTETMYGLGAERSDENRAQGQVLLPTPTSTDHKASGATYAATDTHHQGTTLTDATVRQAEAFGQYALTIARWETVLGRPAPAPTEPTGKGGAHRLSPRFVEWMMGLPDGWVTNVGLSRNEELKALGNGVVPQQAEAALRHMLTVREAALRSEVAA